MKWKNLLRLLKFLISKGQQFQYHSVVRAGVKPRFYFTSTQYIFWGISLASIYVMPKGISNNLSGYIITALSLYIGLFLNLIIVIFNRFYDDFKEQIEASSTTETLTTFLDNINPVEKARLKRLKNFYLQFTTLTTYSILISLLTTVLLAIQMIDGFLDYDIFKDFTFCGWGNVNILTTLNFLFASLIVAIRVTTVYFLFNFLLITTYAVASMYEYIYSEFKKVRF